LEEEFGDIKEPKLAIHYLITIWAFIGIVVSYMEIKKYIRKNKKPREGVDYNKSYLKILY
jgi:hypothetical protein